MPYVTDILSPAKLMPSPSAPMDRTVIIADRCWDNTPQIPMLDLEDQHAKVGNLDLGYSSVSSEAPAPDNSAPDISELPERTLITNPSPVQKDETDLSRLLFPNEVVVEALPEQTFKIMPGTSEQRSPN